MMRLKSVKHGGITLLTVLIVSVSSITAGNRPNFIFLFADDQRPDTIGAHGNPHIQTPNLDRMAKEGFSFRKNYCAGSFSGAVCVASRAMLMTGKHWMSLPKDKPQSNWDGSITLPRLMENHGNYQSFIIGKWHNGKNTLDQSFTDGRSLYMGGMADHADFEVQHLTQGKLSDRYPAGGFSSTVFADEAIRYLESPDSRKLPFFLYVSFLAPHDPRNPPEKYRQTYYKKRPPLPKNFLPQHPFQNAPQSTMGRDESLAEWPRTKEIISDQLCEYYGLITHLDEQVGRIFESLQGSPHAHNTYVIYTADHGLSMGSHGLLGKQNIYEQSMRCPLIIWGPNIPGNQESEAFSYVHDLFATVCDLAGVEKPESVDSLSLLPIIKGQKRKVHDYAFLPFQDNQRSINDGHWKLHVYPKIGHQLLFNLTNDPLEMEDLAGEPEHQSKLEEMWTKMKSAREAHGDWYPISVDTPLDKTPQFSNDKRRIDKWQPQWIRDKYFGSF